ncbi:MAG: hypothetical protein PHQ23_13960 [Candidatus Wallbacteria bacterium]|nr:hypothetical protein [Candidatus Wallbacteria bacterium]
MKKILVRVRNIVLVLKFYLQRTMSWVSLANSGMIMFLVFSKLQQEYRIEMDISSFFIPLYLACLALMIFIGYLDDRLNLYSREARIAQNRSPFIVELFARLDRIEKQLERLER